MAAFTIIVLIVILFLSLIYLYKTSLSSKEAFATSPATVMQLTAKGRSDQYLTGPYAGTINPLQKLIPEATKTKTLPYFYVGWTPGIPDTRRTTSNICLRNMCTTY